MKLTHTLFLTPLLLIATTTHADQIYVDAQWQEPIQEIAPKPRPNEKAAAIIGSVAGILNGVGTIVDNPRDKQNISQGVTGILAHIINIALMAGKRDCKSRQELFDLIFDELHLDQEMREIIKLKVEKIQSKELNE
jgi:hypothetical protein